jgi:hypothetical protein
VNLEKHPFIINLVRRLRQDLSSDDFILNDYWDADLLAQGLSRPDSPYTLVYVLLSTERVGDSIEPREGLYCFECEIEAADPENIAEVVRTGDDVDYDTVLRVVQQHLAVPTTK